MWRDSIILGLKRHAPDPACSARITRRRNQNAVSSTSHLDAPGGSATAGDAEPRGARMSIAVMSPGPPEPRQLCHLGVARAARNIRHASDPVPGAATSIPAAEVGPFLAGRIAVDPFANPNELAIVPARFGRSEPHQGFLAASQTTGATSYSSASLHDGSWSHGRAEDDSPAAGAAATGRGRVIGRRQAA